MLDIVFGGGILMLIAVNSVCHYNPVLRGLARGPFRVQELVFFSSQARGLVDRLSLPVRAN